VDEKTGQQRESFEHGRDSISRAYRFFARNDPKSASAGPIERLAMEIHSREAIPIGSSAGRRGMRLSFGHVSLPGTFLFHGDESERQRLPVLASEAD